MDLMLPEEWFPMLMCPDAEESTPSGRVKTETSAMHLKCKGQA